MLARASSGRKPNIERQIKIHNPNERMKHVSRYCKHKLTNRQGLGKHQAYRQTRGHVGVKDGLIKNPARRQVRVVRVTETAKLSWR